MLQALDPILSVADDAPFAATPYEEPRIQPLIFRAAALLVLVCAAYCFSFQVPFIWTDEAQLIQNPAFKSSAGLTTIWNAAHADGAWQPLTDTLLWGEFHLWRDQHVANYHVVGLGLHVGTVLLIWLIFRRLGVSGAWLIAAVFGLHPLQVQPVVWISQQGVLLAAFFSCCSVLLLLRLFDVQPPEQDRAGSSLPALSDDLPAISQTIQYPAVHYLAAMLLGFAALLCSPVAYAFPFVVMLLLKWRMGRIGTRRFLLLLPYLLAAVAAIGLSIWANLGGSHPGAGTQGHAASLLWRAVEAGWTPCFYVLLLFWPRTLLIYPQPPSTFLMVGQVILATVSLCAIACAWLVPSFRRSWICCAISTYFLLILSASSWFPTALEAARIGDRIAYPAACVPIAVIIGGLAWTIDRYVKDDRARLMRLAAVLCLPPALGMLALLTVQRFADETQLWNDVLAADPTSRVAHRRLAALYVRSSQHDLASRELEYAVAADPHDLNALLDLAHLSKDAGRLADSRALYERVLDLDSRNTSARLSLANIDERSGRLDDAVRRYQQLICDEPGNVAAHNNLAMIFAQQGKLDEAVQECAAAVLNDPTSAPARLNYATVLFRLGRPHDAADALREALRLDPNSYEMYNNAGTMLAQLQAFPEAERMFRNGVKLKPDSPELWNNLGLAQAAQKRWPEAIFSYHKAIALKPDYRGARENLAEAMRQRDAATEPSPPRAAGTGDVPQ